MSAWLSYLYKSNNSIAYKTGSVDVLNVKRGGAESDEEDQDSQWASGPPSMEDIDGTGGRNRSSGEERYVWCRCYNA